MKSETLIMVIVPFILFIILTIVVIIYMRNKNKVRYIRGCLYNEDCPHNKCATHFSDLSVCDTCTKGSAGCHSVKCKSKTNTLYDDACYIYNSLGFKRDTDQCLPVKIIGGDIIECELDKS